MADYYADSSVLAKRHVIEVGSVWVEALMDLSAGNLIFTASISIVEVYSALNRRMREGTLGLTKYADIIADFESLHQGEYRVIPLTPPVISRAAHLLERYPLRAYDAVQLATALDVRDLLSTGGISAPTFLSADDRLLTAARQEWFSVDNPNNHP